MRENEVDEDEILEYVNLDFIKFIFNKKRQAKLKNNYNFYSSKKFQEVSF
jgi:hypothetical protein